MWKYMKTGSSQRELQKANQSNWPSDVQLLRNGVSKRSVQMGILLWVVIYNLMPNLGYFLDLFVCQISTV